MSGTDFSRAYKSARTYDKLDLPSETPGRTTEWARSLPVREFARGRSIASSSFQGYTNRRLCAQAKDKFRANAQPLVPMMSLCKTAYNRAGQRRWSRYKQKLEISSAVVYQRQGTRIQGIHNTEAKRKRSQVAYSGSSFPRWALT
jgi:hypothetical protein